MTNPPSEQMSNLSMNDGSKTATGANKGTAKRDALRANELAVQAKWEECKAFESDYSDLQKEKFIVTFPFPYSNGHLHIGHAFSLTKAVFRAQFERHMGKNVLFPFAFHCTGMPIQAAANKLKAELTQFGIPPQFPEEDPEVRAQMEAELKAEASSKAASTKSNLPENKAKGKKTKLVSKTGTGIVRQYNILKKMVPVEEIPQFVDPVHWLMYFPPIGVNHMKRFGSGVDWRRAFITTSVNPYYDAFIRWQFNVLRSKNKILFGKRNNVFSLLDGQVCADHDRSEGEGVGPQEYTLVKLKVLEPNSEINTERHTKIKNLLKANPNTSVYLVPATLRPETMFGQTNCFVLPTGEYGAYYIDALDEIFIMSHRAARGISCQVIPTNKQETPKSFTKEFGKITKLETFTGEELLALPLKAPKTSYECVYTLPLLTISMSKGTGVVTSVPSDAPDDYIALKNLKEKPEFAEKYGITRDMLDPYEVLPVITIEGYGEASAVFMCEKLKIKSFNDKAKLAQAKDETYLKGFTIGIMSTGPHKGKKVSDAKPIIKQEMIDSGEAVIYFEPESKVMSRTGDECVVAATDQWYLVYGDEDWSNAVREHITDPAKFNAYDHNALAKYEYTVGWLKEWACTRQFGLGTYLPWDKEWVIESLSDSTIYMAYYTIAHVLQGNDNLNGESQKSPGKIDAKDLTDEVFDYIFRNKPYPEGCSIAQETLEKMKNEFRYWYPMDLRVSAKDLIPNHLTMALYNHAAIWDDEPDLWPMGYYTNGHVLVDAEKMSKSKGNFLMMDETVEKFSADGTRIACADAGDSLDDANFSRETADKAILALCNEETWIMENVNFNGLRTGDDKMFVDNVLENEVNRLTNLTAECYSAMQFREGLQKGWFEMLRARNEYRSWCEDSKIPMHKDMINLWVDSIIVLICPIAPHWSENMWEKLGKEGLAVKAPWPKATEENKLLTRQASFLRDTLKAFRAQADKSKKRTTTASILVTDSYPEWKNEVLLWMHSKYDSETKSFAPTFMKELKTWASSKDKKMIKLSMQFASWMKREVEEVGAMAMEIKMPYDQKQIILESEKYLMVQLKMDKIEVINLSKTDDISMIPPRTVENVNPGKPCLWMHQF